MIKLRAIGRCLFFLQSCRTSNYVRSVAMECHAMVSKRRLRYGALAKKILGLLKLSVRVEVSSVETK